MAIRMPISRMRRATKPETTPNTPTAASRMASRANPVERDAAKRRDAAEAATTRLTVATCSTGWFGSTERIRARAAGATLDGSPFVRMTTTMSESVN